MTDFVMFVKVGQPDEVPRILNQRLCLPQKTVLFTCACNCFTQGVCTFRPEAHRPELALDPAGLPYPAALVAATRLFQVSAAPYLQLQLACRRLSSGWLETVPLPGHKSELSV